MDFVFASSIPGKIAACTKHNCGSNMLKLILLKNLLEFIVLVTSMSIKKLPEIFLFRSVPLLAWQKVHICMPHSQPNNYIVYSVREKTCTARDRFVYFRVVKSCQIRHPEVRIRYPDTSEGSHRIGTYI